MRTLKFYGCSDDLIEIEGTTGNEPDETTGDPGIFKVSWTNAIGEAEGLYVQVQYSPENVGVCWMVGVMPLDEDIPFPDWKMDWRTYSNGYSTELELSVPDGVIVEQVAPAAEDDEQAALNARWAVNQH